MQYTSAKWVAYLIVFQNVRNFIYSNFTNKQEIIRQIVNLPSRKLYIIYIS